MQSVFLSFGILYREETNLMRKIKSRKEVVTDEC